MSDLTEALEELSDRPGANWEDVDPSTATVIAAARRQVALEPDQCGTCGGSGKGGRSGYPGLAEECPTCHGRGWLYKAATVEAVAKVLHSSDAEVLHPDDAYVSWERVIAEAARSPWHKQAVAVLDALRLLDQEAPR